MHLIERWAQTLRHAPGLHRAEWLWRMLRPVYNRTVALLGRTGLRRVINGTDPLYVMSAHRGVSETYEPRVWRHLMEQLKPGDVVADVGANIGLYSVAMAKRVGRSGRVFAFEPDPDSYASLYGHAKLNETADIIEAIAAAVGQQTGEIEFYAGHGLESGVAGTIKSAQGRPTTVPLLSLDDYFAGRRLDLLKIDVEGYEQAVIAGATKLLGDHARSPRKIFIEVHPWAWPGLGFSGEALLALLAQAGYSVTDLNGEPILEIREYGEIVAKKTEAGF